MRAAWPPSGHDAEHASTNAGHPTGGAKPHQGKVHSTDGKILTDQEKGEKGQEAG